MKYYFWTEKMGVGYHGQPLIENIEFGLEQGEILTLIGPNGAGKSTILKSIARQLDVINGEKKTWNIFPEKNYPGTWRCF